MPLFAGGLFGVVVTGLWIFCLVDVITTADGTTRNLPKLGWLLIVLLLPVIGSILWLVAGRPEGAGDGGGYRQAPPSRYTVTHPATNPATNPDDDAEFLRKCRERVEQQRRAARQQRDQRQREQGGE